MKYVVEEDVEETEEVSHGFKPTWLTRVQFLCSDFIQPGADTADCPYIIDEKESSFGMCVLQRRFTILKNIFLFSFRTLSYAGNHIIKSYIQGFVMWLNAIRKCNSILTLHVISDEFLVYVLLLCTVCYRVIFGRFTQFHIFCTLFVIHV